jgi:putative effector of murein hydrolase
MVVWGILEFEHALQGPGMPGAGALLMGMLIVVVLCDGVRVFLQRRVVRRHAAEIFGTVLLLSLSSLFITAHLAAALQLRPDISRSLLPRSITVALALPMTRTLGGVENLTAAVVCATGLVGAALGQRILGIVRMRDEISRGVAQGACAHGLGASAMAATEPQALPFCAVRMLDWGAS